MIINFRNSIIALIVLISVPSMYAKTVGYFEDVYAMQAPASLVAKAEKVAELVDFTADYELVVPKKAGVQVNPWNKFVAFGINPQTQNPFMVINEQWFSTMPEDQQEFFLARNLLILKHGTTPLTVKITPFLFSLLLMVLYLLFYWGLGHTPLATQKRWKKMVMVMCIGAICNLTFLNALQLKCIRYLSARYDQHINAMVVQKTNNKEAAIKALEYAQETITNELKNGESFWKPYATSFADYAQDLKKSKTA